MQPFTVTQPFKNIYHIQDVGQVCFTLIRGEHSTLLFDTGMGFFNVKECIAPYINGPLHVVLSHGHYDHACGQHYFQECLVHPDDLERCQKTVSAQSRASILNRMRKRGMLPDDYADDQFLNGTPDTIKPLTEMMLDLGGLNVQFIRAQGHTMGSIVAYIDQYKLLLTGDTWNPHTWLFFPESSSLQTYTKTAKSLRDLPAEHVLRSHDQVPATMQRFRNYIDGLNEDTFTKAKPCLIPPYTHIRTFCCNPEPESTLVFNADKRS